MSVLIRIEMPGSCLQCGACIFEDNESCYCGFDETEKELKPRLNFRPAWCPLVESDIQPVKFGEWHGTVCTVCGGSTSDYYDCKFCPKCGAKMELEE